MNDVKNYWSFKKVVALILIVFVLVLFLVIMSS